MNPPPRIPFTRTTASVLLDLLRGIAALLVCLEHWRALLFVDYKQIVAHRQWFAVPYLISGAGHQAVVIFFILSGYLISGSVFRLMEKGQWSWRLYLTHRVVRLWIVLIPALLLGALLDYAGLHFRIAPALYAGTTGTHMVGNVAAALHASTLFGNLIFLQGIVVSTFGSNGALWSLANEFWYYILFPCALIAMRRGAGWTARILHVAVFLLLAWFVGRQIMLLFPLWLLGSILAWATPFKSGTGVRVAATVFYVPVLFYLAKETLFAGWISDYLLGILTFLFIWLLLGARDKAPSRRWVPLSRGLARFSYTLYLVHTPFLILLVGFIAGEHRWQPNARDLVPGLGMLLLAVGYAYVVAGATEFRTDAVRGWVERRVLGKTVPPKLPVQAAQ